MKSSENNSSLENLLPGLDQSELLLIEGGTFGYDVGIALRFGWKALTEGYVGAVTDYAANKVQCDC